MSYAYYAGAGAAAVLGFVTGGYHGNRRRGTYTAGSISGMGHAYGAYNYLYTNRHTLQSYLPKWSKWQYHLGDKRPREETTPPPRNVRARVHDSGFAPSPPHPLPLPAENDAAEVTQTSSMTFTTYAPSMDHLPQGISAKSFHINLGGKKHKRPDGFFSYMYQHSAEYSTASGNTAGDLSGEQFAQVIDHALVTKEFAGLTRTADNVGGIGLNLFTLDPDQFNTGSGYVAAGGNVPGNISASDYVNKPIVPRQDYLNVNAVRYNIDLTNFTNNPGYYTLYVLKCKTDLANNESATQSWVYDDQAWYPGIVEFTMPATGKQPGDTSLWLPSKNIVHTVPTSSLEFNSKYAVIKVIPCMIAASGTCRIKLNLHVNRTYSREQMQLKYERGVIQPKGSICLLLVGHGAPVKSTVVDQNQPIYGLANVGMILTKKYSCGAVKNKDTKRYSTLMYSDQYRQAPTTDQEMVRDSGAAEVQEI